MSSRKRNIITGVAVLGSLITLLWMVLTFSGGAMQLFKPRGLPVVFTCERADGLSDGSPVFFKGVEIGTVTSVHRLADNEHVRIEGELENTPPLPHNLIGQVIAQSSLGTSTQINLNTLGPAVGALEAHQEISVRFVGNSLFPPELSDLVAQANRQELVKHVDEAVISFQAQVVKIGKVMESTQQLIGDPKVREDLDAAMTNIRKVTERANAIAAKLDTLTTNADTAVTDVRTTLAKTDKNLDRLTRQVGDDLDKFGQAFAQFQEIAAKINAGKGTAGALVNDPKLYDELTLTARQLNSVARSLDRLVDQWEHEGVYIKTTK